MGIPGLFGTVYEAARATGGGGARARTGEDGSRRQRRGAGRGRVGLTFARLEVPQRARGDESLSAKPVRGPNRNPLFPLSSSAPAAHRLSSPPPHALSRASSFIRSAAAPRAPPPPPTKEMADR
jgi:hypothetical protein